VTHKKLLGLALGEKSLTVAEVIAGEKPQLRKVAEWVYPEGKSLQTPVELGTALVAFLKAEGFGSHHVIVGVPVKWLLVKSKEVPVVPTDTLESMLRLQAETEFSSELKDLVFDYTAGIKTGASQTVLLLATPRSHLDRVNQLCAAAGLTAAAVTSSALALGITTGTRVKRPVLVLSSTDGASELTSQDGEASGAIRHMRSIEPMAPFVSELRRTVSTFAAAEGEREIVLWGAEPAEADALGKQLGWTVRAGKLPALGVDDSTVKTNGDGQKYAAAVALAVSAMSEAGTAVDFLHSRLAPPPPKRIERWMVVAAIAVVAIIVGSIYAYQYQQTQQQALDQLNAQVDAQKQPADNAKVFVDKVSLAKNWHAGDPRYLACLRDMTEAVPDDGGMYATSLSMKEIMPMGNTATPDPDVGKIQCQLDGKARDAGRPGELSDLLKNNKAFSSVSLTGTNYIPRERATSFTINFKYDPTKAAPMMPPDQQQASPQTQQQQQRQQN
jgi:hypothetical protein